MELDIVELSRLQFAMTAMYHFLFVPLTLGLAVIVGFIAAFITAFFVVRFLLDYISRHGFAAFAYWRIFVGALGLWGILLFG